MTLFQTKMCRGQQAKTSSQVRGSPRPKPWALVLSDPVAGISPSGFFGLSFSYGDLVLAVPPGFRLGLSTRPYECCKNM